MSFFNEDQKEVLEALRGDDEMFSEIIDFLKGPIDRFLSEEIAPNAHENNKKEKFDRESFRQLGELGYFLLTTPSEFGGMDVCPSYQMAAIESAAKADGGFALSTAIHITCMHGILDFASDELIEQYVPPLSTGEEMAAFVLSEPDSGSDAQDMETTYKVDPDTGNYLLNGTKYWISNGLSADTYVVFARNKETDEVSGFLVRKGRNGTFEQHKIKEKVGVRSSETAELIFRDYEVPSDHMMGSEGQGFNIAMNMLNGGRIGVASWVTGISQGAYEKVMKYAHDRELFDQNLKDLDVVKSDFSEMLQKIWAGRHLAYTAAYHKHEGRDIEKRAAMAKVFASESAMYVSERAMALAGGYGYVEDSRIDRHLRDAQLGRVGEGANELLNVEVIPRFVEKDFDPNDIPEPW